MTKATYTGLVEATPEGVGISFPDLPGCVSWSEDGTDLIQHAEEALSLHLEGMAEDGMVIPAPTPVGKLVKEAYQETNREVVYAMVTVEAPDASERVNIYLAKSLLERIDSYCREEGVNRSAFFVQAARTQLGMMRTGTKRFG
jgi:predicted RNase H-like HicB family nuclease